MNAKGGKFPSVVWYRDGETIFEARLTNRVSGEYHGYAPEIGPNSYRSTLMPLFDYTWETGKRRAISG